MNEVELILSINLDNDHCKYGEDLNDYINKITQLQSIPDKVEMEAKASELRIHPILNNLKITKDKHQGAKESWYILMVNGKGSPVVTGNEIWMHTLVYELIELLTTKKEN